MFTSEFEKTAESKRTIQRMYNFASGQRDALRDMLNKKTITHAKAKKKKFLMGLGIGAVGGAGITHAVHKHQEK